MSESQQTAENDVVLAANFNVVAATTCIVTPESSVARVPTMCENVTLDYDYDVHSNIIPVGQNVIMSAHTHLNVALC